MCGSEFKSVTLWKTRLILFLDIRRDLRSPFQKNSYCACYCIFVLQDINNSTCFKLLVITYERGLTTHLLQQN